MGKVVILFITFTLLLLILQCGPHHDEEPRFHIRNITSGSVEFGYFNEGFISGRVPIQVGETYFVDGGGILSVDSIIFIHLSTHDTLIFRHEVHEDQILKGNHFFNNDNWVKESKLRFFYTLRDEDFEW